MDEMVNMKNLFIVIVASVGVVGTLMLFKKKSVKNRACVYNKDLQENQKFIFSKQTNKEIIDIVDGLAEIYEKTSN